MKALELAKRLENPEEYDDDAIDGAAAELRRLAEVNAELLGALDKAHDAMMDASGCSMPAARELSEAIHKVRTAITKAKEQQ